MAQKFKYNGKELTEDLGLNWYDYGARNFDAALGRFMNIDPAADNYQSWTPYHYVMNNPVIFVDPTGMFTELFDQDGNKVGEDENGKDGNTAVVTDQKEVDRIKQNTGKGTHTESSTLKSTVKLPSAFVRGEMGKAVVKSDTPNSMTSSDGGDTKGGFHEEGGTYGTSNGEDHVVHAKSGKANMTMEENTKATVDTLDPQLDGTVPDDYKITGTFHVHPKGKVGKRGFVQKPSAKDKKIVKNTAKRGSGNHFVLGSRSGKVYIYNSSDQVATFPLKSFISIGNK